MREKRRKQANEVDTEAHSRRDSDHANKSTSAEPELPVRETTQENCPVFVHGLGSQEKGRFVVSDLVWGKVKSHPWWPGQIIDPSDASTLAIKCQKKDALLVAYFWDKTFAWCEESQLKPFFSNFSFFEKQVGSDAFSGAVKSVLKEVSRRIDAGTICSCLNEKSLFKIYPKMENAGVRQGFEHYPVDMGKVVNSLNPTGLVVYIRDLALNPGKGTTDKLGLLVSKYYIRAFHRWMAFTLEKQTEPVIVPTENVNLPENAISRSDVATSETPLTHINLSTPSTTPVVDSSTEKPKRRRGRGRPRKKPLELEKVDTTAQETLSNLSNKTNLGPEKVPSAKKRKVHSPQIPSDKGFSGSDNMPDSLYWSGKSLFLQADGKRVVSAVRPVIIPMADKKSDECIPTALLLSFSKIPSDMEILRVFSRHGPLRGEMEKEVEENESRVKLVFKKRADAEMAFGSLRKQNVFGSSLLSYRLVDLPFEVPDSSQHAKMVEVPNGEDHCLLEEMRIEAPNEFNPTAQAPNEFNPTAQAPNEFNPTALLLSFSNKSGKLPSEMELIRIFSRHGPLEKMGVEKEVEGTMNRFRIAFKKHSSAEMAFTSLRKNNVFGPSLCSYRLVSLPVEASKKRLNEKHEAPNKEDPSKLDVPAPRANLVQSRRAVCDNRAKRPVNIDVGLTSTVQGDIVSDISVDLSSIAQGARTGDISVAPSSIVEGVMADDVSIAPSITVPGVNVVDPESKKEGEDAAVMPFDQSSSVQSTAVAEMSTNPSSTIRAAEFLVDSSSTLQVGEMLVDPASTVQGESFGETLINSSSTGKGKTVGEVLIVSSRAPEGEFGGGCEILSDLSSTGENTIGEVRTVTSRTKDGEVGGGCEMSNDPSSTGQEDALFEMLIDPSGTGENGEPGTNKSDGSKTENQGTAAKIFTFAKPSSKSNGSMLLECTPSRSAIRPPFQKSSPIWRPLESLELFTRTPQQPHFKKLESYCQEMRDGMAIGLMVTYANLVESIKKLSIDDDVAVFEQKFDCLKMLDENGFNVDMIRTRLNQLLQMKTDYAGSGLKQAELEKKLSKKETDSMSMVGLIEKIKSDVAKLDEQINALSEQSRKLVVKRDQLLELTVGNGHEISRLKNELSYVNKSQGLAREEFTRVLAEPFGGDSGS